MHRRTRLLALAVSAVFSAASLFGAVVTKVSDDAFAPLRNAAAARKIVLDRLPIYDDKRSTIELEEFQLWAPDAKVIVYGDHGVVLQMLDPPKRRFFRGSVNGDPQSFAYFSTDAAGADVQGFVATSDRQFSVATQHRRVPGRRELSSDVFMSAFDDSDTMPMTGATWQCDLDKMPVKYGPPEPVRAAAMTHPAAPQGISGTQSYAIKVDIETDYELLQTAGGNVTTLTNYVTNLSGAVATIYKRDLNTVLKQGNIGVYNVANATSDPWNASDPGSGLDEIGNYYHTVKTRTSSAVVFLSGKNIPGGVAWLNAIGRVTDFPYTCTPALVGGCFGGPYAWCGGIDVGGVPDPNATTGGIVYGMPSSNYWPLAEYAHELGHNMGSPHTHCMATSDAERIASGFTDGSPADATSDFVDHCYANEGMASCYGGAAGGTDYLAGSQGVFKGTIMSYCHNVFVGNVPQSRYTFGVATEPSHHALDDYLLRATGPMGSSGTNIVTGVGTFTISAITAPATIAAAASGTASISAISGASYDWTITNGTITSTPPYSNSINFTAGSAGTATIRAAAYSGTTKVGVTDTKLVTVTTGCAIVMLPATTSTINVISGSAFNQTITSTGGAAPYTYTLTTGTLPTGLSLSTGGVLSGTTTQTGNFSISIKSTDSTTTCSATSNYTIHVGTCTSGDINGDGSINAADVFYLINNLFAGGPPPPAAVCANPNGLGTTDVADVFYLIKYLFAGGLPPV